MTERMTNASQKPARTDSWGKSIRDFLWIIVLITAAKSAIAEPYYVPSGSMEPTLLIGDELLATKYPYGYSSASLPAFLTLPNTERILGALPKRGDVVVFRWPGDRSQVWVKRVVGLPGDHIRLVGGRLWINGQQVDVRPDGLGQAENEDGLALPAQRFIETLPGNRPHAIFKLSATAPYDNVPETVVPPEHVFVMGDNRDNSADSRVPVSAGGVGMLPVSDLIGRVDALVGSWNLATRHQPVWNWPSGLRLSRFFTTVQ